MKGKEGEFFKNIMFALKNECKITTRGLTYADADVVSTSPFRPKSGVVASPVLHSPWSGRWADSSLSLCLCAVVGRGCR